MFSDDVGMRLPGGPEINTHLLQSNIWFTSDQPADLAEDQVIE